MSYSASDADTDESMRGTRIHPPIAMASCTIMSEKRPLRSTKIVDGERRKIRPVNTPAGSARSGGEIQIIDIPHRRSPHQRPITGDERPEPHYWASQKWMAPQRNPRLPVFSHYFWSISASNLCIRRMSRLLAQNLHRLEQRRGHPRTSHSHPNRRKG